MPKLSWHTTLLVVESLRQCVRKKLPSLYIHKSLPTSVIHSELRHERALLWNWSFRLPLALAIRRRRQFVIDQDRPTPVIVTAIALVLIRSGDWFVMSDFQF